MKDGSPDKEIRCAVCGCLKTKYTPVRLVPEPYELAFGRVKKIRLCDSCRVDGQVDMIFALGLL